MKTYTPNELLDLQLKYKNDHTVLELIDTVKDWQVYAETEGEEDEV